MSLASTLSTHPTGNCTQGNFYFQSDIEPFSYKRKGRYMKRIRRQIQQTERRKCRKSCRKKSAKVLTVQCTPFCQFTASTGLYGIEKKGYREMSCLGNNCSLPR